MRVSFKTADGQLEELQAWLTRRLVKNFWAALIRAMETQVRLERPQAAHAVAELVGLQHQAVVTETKARGDFDKPFDPPAQTVADSESDPVSAAPILVRTARFMVHASKATRIHFGPEEGEGFEVGLTPDMLHGFSALLLQAVNAAEWSLELHLPAPAVGDFGPRVLN